MTTTRKAHGLHVTESNLAKQNTCSTTDEKMAHHRHSNSADEGIAELDGPTSVPVLLEMLREKDGRIQVLGENISRVSVNIQIAAPDSLISMHFLNCINMKDMKDFERQKTTTMVLNVLHVIVKKFIFHYS